MRVQEYLADPCGKLSVPYWKWIRLTLPPDMRIIHDREFEPMTGYTDACFFRLYHDLRNIPETVVPGLEIVTIGHDDHESVLRILRASYPGIRVDGAWLKQLTATPVYAPELWRLAVMDGIPVGCVLADCDPHAREGILEWVQILPQYRRRGIAKALVCDVLRRMDADFATVSGDRENPSKPEVLYRSCGFTGKDVWHILRRK